MSIAMYENPNWEPLEAAMAAAGLGRSTCGEWICGEWMWMAHGADGAESYKHIASWQYIWIDQAGNVYHGTGLQITGPAIREMLETGEVA
jgi:hypothetical protein